MSEISPDDRRDVCAALLTMASITSSYKVESTKAISNLWNDIRSNILINTDIDYLAVILSLGRIEDLKAELINLEDIQDIITGFRERLDTLGVTDGTLTDQAAAYLTTSCISHSNEVETTTSVLTLWDEIRKNVIIKDPLDLASAILATGRIMDLRADIQSSEVLSEIVDNIRKEMEPHNVSQVDYKELSILLLSAAIVELSPKVEKYRDIVKTWVDLRTMLTITNIKDAISVILFSGKIRDMDTSILMFPSSLTDEIQFVRSALDEVS